MPTPFSVRGERRSIRAVPVLAWLAINSAALGFSLADGSFGRTWPNPPSAAAVDVLLVVQTVTAGVLFPWLLRDRWSAVAIGVLGVGFAVIAGDLAGLGRAEMFHVGQTAALIVIVCGVWAWSISHGVTPGIQANGLSAVFIFSTLWLSYVCADFGGSVTFWTVVSPFHAVLNPGVAQWGISGGLIGVALGRILIHQVIHHDRTIS